MDTDAFREFSTKYGLDYEIVASFCESFATHVDLPKEKWVKYNPPIEEICEELVIAKTEMIAYNPNPIVPTIYIGNLISLLGLGNMLKLQLWFIRVILEHLHPLRKLKLNLLLLWLRISWPIILMGMLFTSAMNLLELLDPMLKINIDLLLACLLFLLK